VRFAALMRPHITGLRPDVNAVRRALLAMVSLTVLLGLLLGVMTMHQHHAAHHGLGQAMAPTAPVAHAHGGMDHAMHGAMSAHLAVASDPRPAPVETVSGNGPADTPGQIALKLCLAVLIGLGGLVLRLVMVARGADHVSAAARQLFAAMVVGLRPRSSGPPGRTTITRLCVLRQ
jgi:hypothetical protein